MSEDVPGGQCTQHSSTFWSNTFDAILPFHIFVKLMGLVEEPINKKKKERYFREWMDNFSNYFDVFV